MSLLRFVAPTRQSVAVLARAEICRVQEHGARSAECSCADSSRRQPTRVARSAHKPSKIKGLTKNRGGVK